MRKIIFLALFGFASVVNAHEQKAHVHGVAELSLAIEDKGGVIAFEAPSESIYGFEHAAKTPAEKKARDQAMDKLKNLGKILAFDATLGCKIQVDKIDAFVTDDDDDHGHSSHGDVHASFKVNCSKPLKNSEVSFSFSNAFSRLNTLKVQIIGDDKQSSVELKKGNGKIKL
ncbi:MAG: DUF2796 domain-containing protein [Deltaproteobacteria bacterium]|nr:DUF2796 domain-containing protein [Deltaproteobacteria bacterium]